MITCFILRSPINEVYLSIHGCENIYVYSSCTSFYSMGFVAERSICHPDATKSVMQ